MQVKRDLAYLLDICQNGQAGVCSDSRRINPGDIFVAVPGNAADGSEFIPDALSRGAAWIVCAPESAKSVPEGKGVPVQDLRVALWQLAQARWHTDALKMKIVGITGTNGKTTCAWLLEKLFASLGETTGLLGTIEYHWPGMKRDAALTTPGALELHEMLAEMNARGVQTLVMEVSSHALAQLRVGGINFAGALFTNLTQDHLDFHKDMESYFNAKARLFLQKQRGSKAMAINSDDLYGSRLLDLAPAGLSYGLEKAQPGRTHLQGELLALTPEGMRLRMHYGRQSWELQTTLIGRFNALNLLAVQALALQMGVDPQHFRIFEEFSGVPGRLERVRNERGVHIFIDYAHTPDALINALKALRGAGFKRIVTVFGCGGNRDRTKRPLMGKAVAENSDIAILTSDNPRLEDPLAIMGDVKPGLATAKKLICEADRREATRRALDMLSPGDALLIAGKGHEDYQIIGLEKRHYSDRETVQEFLNCA